MLTFSKLTKEQLTETDWSAQPIASALPKSEETAFAAWLDGQVIGVAALADSLSDLQPTSGILTTVFVLPQYRRQGVARMLVGLAAGAVMEQGAYFLRGSVPTTEEAAAFAEKIGFHTEADSTGFAILDLTDTKGLRQH